MILNVWVGWVLGVGFRASTQPTIYFIIHNLSMSSEKSTQLLGAFASVLGILSLFLYFTAWIYRWSYYKYYSIELNQLNFPLRSFFFIPIQVFFGNPWAFLKTIMAFLLVAIAIKSSLWLLQPISLNFKLLMQSFQPSNPRQRFYFNCLNLSQKVHQSLPLKSIRNLTSIIPKTLQKDLIIVLWLLMILFWLARYQGWQDARRDAINETSSLPTFTYIFPDKQLSFARKLDDIDRSVALKGYHIIGDTDLFFKGLLNQEINDQTSSPPIVWRLLLENNHWIYCFPALSRENVEKNQVPPVLAIRKDKEGQLMILAP